MKQSKQVRINFIKEYLDQGLIDEKEAEAEIAKIEGEYEETSEENDYRNRVKLPQDKRRTP